MWVFISTDDVVIDVTEHFVSGRAPTAMWVNGSPIGELIYVGV